MPQATILRGRLSSGEGMLLQCTPCPRSIPDTSILLGHGFRVAWTESCCHAGEHRALPTSTEEESSKQVEPWQDVLLAEKLVLYELSCRSPSK